jgi:hypothetical protein
MVGDPVVGVRLAGRLLLEHPAHLRELALVVLAAAELVDRAVLRGRHQPAAGVGRDALGRPLFERGDEGVLGQLLG